MRLDTWLGWLVVGLVLPAVAGCGASTEDDLFSGSWRPGDARKLEKVVVSRLDTDRYVAAFVSRDGSAEQLTMKRLGTALYAHVATSTPESGPSVPAHDVVLRWRRSDGRLLFSDDVVLNLVLTKASAATELPAPIPSASR